MVARVLLWFIIACIVATTVILELALFGVNV